MSADLRSINAKWFSLLAGEDIETWNLALDAKVQHKVYGLGQIIHIEHRNNYSPMITLLFSNEVKKWPPKSFDNENTTISVSTDIALKADLLEMEFNKATRDKEVLASERAAEIHRRLCLSTAERQAEDKLVREASRNKMHQYKLLKMGKEYQGTRSPRSNRTPFCHACKSDLRSDDTDECIACGWLICNCGSCGCDN